MTSRCVHGVVTIAASVHALLLLSMPRARLVLRLVTARVLLAVAVNAVRGRLVRWLAMPLMAVPAVVCSPLPPAPVGDALVA